MSRINITSTCRGCGLAITLNGDNGPRILTAIDTTHDIIRPDCPQTTARNQAREKAQTAVES